MKISGYIPSSVGAAFATVTEPDTPAQRPGLVLIPPFGQEAKSTVRVYARLSQRLAYSGYPSLRLDLCGTGDSTGDHAAITWQSWLDDIRTVLDSLSASAPRPWGLLGTRLGGLLAAETARSMEVSSLILIEPIADGAAHLDDLIRRRAIRSMMSGDEASATEPSPADAWAAGQCVDFGGYPVNPQLAADLRDRQLNTILESLSPSLPITLFRVAATQRLSGPWTQLFETVNARPTGTAEILRDKPFWGQIEYYESDIVLDKIIEAYTD
ncbi:MAG: serine aminopeptidase domain-containing protein [Verrucomicrobiota bacterium]